MRKAESTTMTTASTSSSLRCWSYSPLRRNFSSDRFLPPFCVSHHLLLRPILPSLPRMPSRLPQCPHAPHASRCLRTDVIELPGKRLASGPARRESDAWFWERKCGHHLRKHIPNTKQRKPNWRVAQLMHFICFRSAELLAAQEPMALLETGVLHFD